MQQLIDEGSTLPNDAVLSSHTQRCSECRERMEVWNQIETVLGQSSPPAQPASQNRLALYSAIVALAAAVLIAFFVSLPNDERVSQNVATESVLQHDDAAIDPAIWWQTVQDRDWIGETMPAVNSVRDGVAPLGRSILQAVAILTTPRGASTS